MSEEAVYLTPAEYADLVRVPIATVRRLIRTGKLEALKIGGQYRLLRPPPPSLQHRVSA